MYERHFHLRERPFALSPDPDYLYPSRVHSEALSYLRYGVEGHAGFVVITGEIGSGKTTLLQSLIANLDARTTVARIMNTMLDPRELLDAIALDYDIDPAGMSKPVLLHKLADFLVQQRRAGRLTLLVVDEAQNLSLPALEEIRMLSNLETEKSKLIQIVLIGQPELRDKLDSRQLQQLRQRITVSYHLMPLDAEDTSRYINHRLKRAAIGAPLEFPRSVTDVVHARSGGVPRIINVIADATLLFAYGVDRRDIDVSIAQEALAELDATGVLASYQEEARPANTDDMTPAERESRRAAAEVEARELALSVREREMRQREQELALRQRRLDEDERTASAARAAQGIAERRRDAPPAAAPFTASPAAAAPVVPPTGTTPPAAGPPSYTYLSGSRATAAPAAASRMQPTTPAPATAPAAQVFRPAAPSTVATVRPQMFEPSLRLSQESSGFWHRVRRALFGVSQPATRA